MISSPLIDHLFEFITEQRKEKMLKVLSERTRYVSVLLEDVYQPHNASAVLRTCDCFGVLDIHILENRNKFIPDAGITMAADQWLNIQTYNGQEKSIAEITGNLRKKGYRIVATTPHNTDVLLHQFDLTAGPVVVMFGSELNGLSKDALDCADEFVKIPMYGFSESLNISVSAAIVLQWLTTEMRRLNLNWKLSDFEKLTIIEQWLRKTIKDSDRIIERWNKEQKNK